MEIFFHPIDTNVVNIEQMGILWLPTWNTHLAMVKLDFM